MCIMKCLSWLNCFGFSAKKRFSIRRSDNIFLVYEESEFANTYHPKEEKYKLHISFSSLDDYVKHGDEIKKILIKYIQDGTINDFKLVDTKALEDLLYQNRLDKDYVAGLESKFAGYVQEKIITPEVLDHPKSRKQRKTNCSRYACT